jgi:hypothetical protein
MTKTRRKTGKRVRARKYGRAAQEKVRSALHEMKRGELKSGRSEKTVKDRKQAIAIGLSQARKAGAKVPAPPRRSSRKTRSSSKRRK